MTMEITKFSEKDMNAAISMARQTWHGYYDEFRAEYIRCIAECIVRHNYTDEDLAFKITCNGEHGKARWQTCPYGSASNARR